MMEAKQLKALDAHFSSGGSLTVAEALMQFGIFALSQRAGELRRHWGRPVVAETVKLESGKRIKRYRYG